MTYEQIEKAAQQYAQRLVNEYDQDIPELSLCDLKFDCQNAFIAGAQMALQNQWVSVEERLPEERKAVLCYMPGMKDSYAEKDMYFDMAVLLEGEFVNLDAEVIHPSHWMLIPIPLLNPEKE